MLFQGGKRGGSKGLQFRFLPDLASFRNKATAAPTAVISETAAKAVFLKLGMCIFQYSSMLEVACQSIRPTEQRAMQV